MPKENAGFIQEKLDKKTNKTYLVARFQYWLDGKRREKTCIVANRSEANRFLKEQKSKLESKGAKALKTDKKTFAQVADDFEKTYLVEAKIVNGVKIKGRKGLRGTKAQMKALRAFFGQNKLTEIKYSDLVRYRDERLDTPVERTGKPRSLANVHRELAMLRRILNVAIQNQILTVNPFKLGDALILNAAEVKRDRVLSREEEKNLLAACDSHDKRKHLRPILICALDTAMRRGEIFRLRWRDIDLKAKVIIIPAEIIKTPKASTVARIVPILTPRLLAELQKLHEKAGGNPDDLVFGIEDNCKKAFAGACKAAKVTGFRLHDCRHTATTRMIAAGIPSAEVMKITGHTQITTFLRYLNPNEESGQRMIDTFTAYHGALQEPLPQVVQESELVN